MPKFEFDMGLSAQQTESIYEGQVCFILAESVQGLKLQLPAANFRAYICADLIAGRLNVEIDRNNKILALRKL